MDAARHSIEAADGPTSAAQHFIECERDALEPVQRPPKRARSPAGVARPPSRVDDGPIECAQCLAESVRRAAGRARRSMEAAQRTPDGERPSTERAPRPIDSASRSTDPADLSIVPARAIEGASLSGFPLSRERRNWIRALIDWFPAVAGMSELGSSVDRRGSRCSGND
jgi:hypothetical protein